MGERDRVLVARKKRVDFGERRLNNDLRAKSHCFCTRQCQVTFPYMELLSFFGHGHVTFLYMEPLIVGLYKK